MTLLDTNVVSEILKPHPSDAVANWVRRSSRFQLFTTVITEAEILYGVATMPAGKRRSMLAAEVAGIFQDLFEDRILPFDSRAAHAYAQIASSRRSIGRPMSQADAQIGAIALTHGASIATRNITDFERCGIELVNPWIDK
jgi:toxin FitB